MRAAGKALQLLAFDVQSDIEQRPNVTGCEYTVQQTATTSNSTSIQLTFLHMVKQTVMRNTFK